MSYLSTELHFHQKIYSAWFLRLWQRWVYLKKGNEEGKFTLNLYRVLRTLSTTQNMVVNFSVLEPLNSVRRINLQEEIMALDFKEVIENIFFPRKTYFNPSFDKINKEVPYRQF